MLTKGNVAVGMLIVLLIGSGLGVLLYGAQMVPSRASSGPAQSPPTALPFPTATTIPLATMGRTVRLVTDSQGRALIWVNRTGISAWDRAYNEHDERGMAQVLRLYETLWVPEGTWVQVVALDGDAVQVELSNGPQAGRRGWARTSALRP